MPKNNPAVSSDSLQQKPAARRGLDEYFSDKRMGAFFENGENVFRLFAPQAMKVELCLFETPESQKGKEYLMTRDDQGVWEIRLWGELFGKYYGFKVYHPGDDLKTLHTVCLDPYAKAVTSFNSYFGTRRSVFVPEDNFDWSGDTWQSYDPRDLIIYEMHVRDMTAHPSSGAKSKGTYKGLTEKNIRGGLPYIKSLGVNAVELLPIMEFANIEIPYQKDTMGRKNTWNPYERNHWGYMTAAFFAPEAYYIEENSTLTWNTWQGKNAEQINELKNMVKAFHDEGIAVIMDVVFNHISEYELGNFKEIDKEYYFRLDDKGNFVAQSGCGNDFKTERPMVRRLIVESILYWMKEYHIDGFRFDLGKLIDWKTVETITREARKINPNVILVCEPWGGGYDPLGFSLRSWGAWNDQFRNGVKGENPNNGLGWIFGKWYGNNSAQRIKSYVNGTLFRDQYGLFIKKEHSVNYLESHDGYTLGDFIRFGLRDVKPGKRIANVDDLARLTPKQLSLNKLAAAFLLTSQGMTMIHSGQEFSRTKAIPLSITEPDTNKGTIDHNSYDKDNETNYINYQHADINNDLLSYYRGLIKLRNEYAAFRRAEYENIHFIPTESEFTLAYGIKYEQTEFLCVFNADTVQNYSLQLPSGDWQVLVDHERGGTKPMRTISGRAQMPPSACWILKRID
jgi:pullulanase/glycogen debranching enzyme